MLSWNSFNLIKSKFVVILIWKEDRYFDKAKWNNNDITQEQEKWVIGWKPLKYIVTAQLNLNWSWSET